MGAVVARGRNIETWALRIQSSSNTSSTKPLVVLSTRTHRDPTPPTTIADKACEQFKARHIWRCETRVSLFVDLKDRKLRLEMFP